MNYKVVTALFDIGREEYDGRRIDTYLEWFAKTLELKCDLIVYTEAQFVDFVKAHRKGQPTEIIIQEFQDVPFYKNYDLIEKIIFSEDYNKRIADNNRIECNFPKYSIIQYSKFGWLSDAALRHPESECFIWMDAGCSRFFGDFDWSKSWPQVYLPPEQLTIQGNVNFNKYYPTLAPGEYCWNNECILVGTLFGGGRDIIFYLEDEVNSIFRELAKDNCVNNEQFALAIFAKRYPELCNIFLDIDGSHLPLFKVLGNGYKSQ